MSVDGASESVCSGVVTRSASHVSSLRSPGLLLNVILARKPFRSKRQRLYAPATPPVKPFTAVPAIVPAVSVQSAPPVNSPVTVPSPLGFGLVPARAQLLMPYLAAPVPAAVIAPSPTSREPAGTPPREPPAVCWLVLIHSVLSPASVFWL